MQVRTYEPGDLPSVIALCEAEVWPSFPADPERAHRALTAPGVTSVVAVDGARVTGFAQLLSDGEITACLALIVVASDQRRRGVARALVLDGFARTRAQRVDLLTDSAAAFYESFPHRRFEGFRLHLGGAEPGPVPS